ncbi:hypothetical protein KKG72_05890 [bacterium]|nr:hypothetical protein [bacterium]MBU1993633.1 hypothetical protein [bacterium]
MKTYMLVFLLSTFLLAQNPQVYSALGDVVYNNVDKIEKLKNMSSYASVYSKIDAYVQDVREAKKEGYAIEAKLENSNDRLYLKKLRELVIINNYFVRSVNSSLKISILNEDSLLFSQIINSGLIDIEKNKDDIKGYYLVHPEDVNVSGVIQTLLDEDAMLRKQREDALQWTKTKTELHEAKMKRIKENDRKKDEAIKKSLEEEVIRQKAQIRAEQKKELSN